MKKHTTILLSAAILLGIGLGFGTTSFAEDKTTDATVNYAPGELIFDPETGDPAASLPTNLNFGSHKIQSTEDEIWVATVDGVQTSALTTGAVAVSDNRGDEASGWSVKVLQTDQFSDGTSELTGAALSIDAGAITNNLSSIPTGATIANSTLDLELGTTADVLTAAPGEGEGETSLALTKFELFVPKDVDKNEANYQTTLTWTLSATPV
ncbi:WxL domain-containing protein [Enterococcus sp. BWB1-3]|uniref:WxL domain-containing protein n=1 Tax=unclassified Enterococcus TaxID=2608891 RepID=UPI0019205AEE|nr:MULTISPECIES: WxL domain-containing protein [unclassified Enterococcus]MBL1228709.1 WxL domain-containing protein [Enterococcus sp. BWB1-3]MCB5952781.1 WxL domain-containing protein [Enterococcus sp. BWT-B8]MCB5953699.1 WxL domain-containing protein [Enterococcus sp. CWB-B31]